ncbi:MAG TPA: TonB family protein [Pyrinomonadaceae bacterium]|nr:TonB family protein [Pyrinomonadaceae bacterium]
MFANLIESQSHGKEFKRRGRFVLATAAAYAVLFFVAGIVSIYAYDARLEAQSNELEVLSWVPPVTPIISADPPRPTRPIRKSVPSNAPVDPNVRVAERTVAIAPTTDPTKVPDNVGTKGIDVPPVTGPVVISNRNVNPPSFGPGNPGDCVTCNGTGPVRVVVATTPPPVPIPPKPSTQNLPSRVLASKAISLPQPPYPPLARQIRLQGAVLVQILVDEAGKVMSAHAVSGSSFLTTSAEEAARRARFTPTLLNGQPVKVQGTIIYNFVLQ